MLQRFISNVSILVLFLVPAALLSAQDENKTPAEVISAIDANFSSFEWVAVLKIDVNEEYAVPQVRLVRAPYERGSIGITGKPLKGEMMHLRVVTNGNRYDIILDFFDSPRAREKGAYKTANAKRPIFSVLSSIFPEEFADKPEISGAE